MTPTPRSQRTNQLHQLPPGPDHGHGGRVCSSISAVPSQKAAWLIETTVLAFIFYSCILSCVSNCVAEMTVLHPSPGGFICYSDCNCSGCETPSYVCEEGFLDRLFPVQLLLHSGVRLEARCPGPLLSLPCVTSGSVTCLI